jgi:hypothetical protein
MATRMEISIDVDVPVRTVYDQWTQFEEFPHFMSGVSEIRQLDNTTLHWVAEIAGVKREWKAKILEQVPDTKVAWAATEGATNAGAVSFAALGPSRTTVTLSLEYEPEGVVERAGDMLGMVERRVEADLEKFKSFIEDAGYASGAWRGAVSGTVGTPGIEDAVASRGDSGAAGVSVKTVIAGVAGVAAAAAGGVAAANKLSGDDTDDVPERPEATYEAVPMEPVDAEDASPEHTEGARVTEVTEFTDMPAPEPTYEAVPMEPVGPDDAIPANASHASDAEAPRPATVPSGPGRAGGV